jgi:hypothetical protein
MKRFLVLLLVAAVFIGMGCDNTLHEQQKSNPDVFEKTPVTITWHGDPKEGVQSYRAKVQVYQMNNRRDTALSLSETYSIAVKQINGKIYSRIDLPEVPEMSARAILNDGEEMVVLNLATNNVEQRITIDKKEEHPFLRLLSHGNSLNHVNLKQIRDEAQRLALNIIENESGKLILELPSEMFQTVLGEEVTRRRISFDVAKEVVIGTEMVTVLEDGTVRTTTNAPLYTENNGEPVKVGSVTVIEAKAPGLVEGLPDDYPIFDSPDDIPTISEEAFQHMINDGTISELPEITFGDPADLSYTETVLEMYSNVELNNVPDSLYRAILK